MKVTQVPKAKLTYDPYDGDCCGTHDGESIVVELGDDIKLLIQQFDSGIGPSWQVTAHHPNQPKPTVRFTTYVGDDGEFCASAGTMPGCL